jgi:transposase InsO family protein
LGRGLHLLQDLGRFVYVAFVVDVFAQRIVGWHAATTKVTDLVLTPLRIALWDPDRQRDPGRAGSAAAPLRCREPGRIPAVVATP